MIKLVAIINVVAWSGFWAFGYLALSATGFTEAQMVTASLLAAAGLITGILAYLRLARAAERQAPVARPAATALWADARAASRARF
ncbi:MAG: hypothetical protein VX228_15580, partial [Pseudomonadota bacterium]|nr:hypothetical protein [Pseudomonadota bacterium]